MKLFYKGKEVAEIDGMGHRFVNAFIFPIEEDGYRWHTVTFAYKNIKKDQADIEPVKLEKTVCDYQYMDEYGIKDHFKVTKIPLSKLKTLTKKVDLWGRNT